LSGVQQIDHHVEDGPLVLGVHALVDFVHTSEGDQAQVLQCHYVQHSGHAALPSRLGLRVQLPEGSAIAEFDQDFDAVLLQFVLSEKECVELNIHSVDLSTLFSGSSK
jgi:hypothetical protein